MKENIRATLAFCTLFVAFLGTNQTSTAGEPDPPSRPKPHVSRVENPLFGYTHLLPSPFNPPAGKLMVGTTLGVGITDFFAIQTNVLSDFFQIYNAKARISLLDFPGFAVGLSFGFQYLNLNTISPYNPSVGQLSWIPGGVIGVEVLPYVALFLGGNLYYPNVNVSGMGFSTSGYMEGAEVESDLSWAYNPRKKGIGNVLSVGATYNTTFSFYGVGISHHWKGFQLGFHYYPNATSYRLLPIFSGGAVVEL